MVWVVTIPDILKIRITDTLLTQTLKGKPRRENTEWNAEMDKALSELKSKLTEKPVLYAPDDARKFIVQTDASDKRIRIIMD